MSLSPDAPPPLAAKLAPRLHALADQGIHFGTSSWKYPGWLGSIYSPERYVTRSKFSQKKFDEHCLTEYAETFTTACGDFAFYQFPSTDFWAKLFGAVPSGFVFGFKVPEHITVIRWPKHARYGVQAGQDNESFLDVGLLSKRFLDRLEPYADRVGPLIFEFATFNKGQFPATANFYNRLEEFLSALPKGWRYAVELRNPEYLSPDYFDLLRGYGVAHVLNAWTRMPPLEEQIELPGVTTANFVVARALLAKGKKYEESVKDFAPFDRIQEVQEEARTALVQIAQRAKKRKAPAFLFVNNRLEGNAPLTIEAVVNRLGV
ncbi:DUF72 domain-containing protein [Singulisphaera sp. Ch08]|uniref:DUF72 domain-containing protein n=1 Tax=Singulisphaera sp. Ch08 TaxID=3120278 RepID=A0AAU7CMW1_9BACT